MYKFSRLIEANSYWILLQSEIKSICRHRMQMLNPWLFFVVVICLFPLASGAEKDLLRNLAPGVIWVAALLATLMSLEHVFAPDYIDGSLDQLLASPYPLTLLVLLKILAHWLFNSVPLILITPVLATSLYLNIHETIVLVLSLILGTPILNLVGAIGVALTIGINRGGILLALMVLPLYVPVLVFGSNVVLVVEQGVAVQGQLLILAAILMLCLGLAPMAIAAALRVTAAQ